MDPWIVVSRRWPHACKGFWLVTGRSLRAGFLRSFALRVGIQGDVEGRIVGRDSPLDRAHRPDFPKSLKGLDGP